jgi:transposase
MPKNQPDLIDTSVLSMSAGVVNCACRIDDHCGQRFIQIHGQLFYSYDLEDALSERFVWVQVLQAGYAKMVEIAAATGIGLRSLQRWKERAKLGGFEALVPKPITGRPRDITSARKREVIRLIALGNSHEQVQSRLDLSGSSIDRIVAEDNASRQVSVQEHLDLDEQEPTIELPEPTSRETETERQEKGPCSAQSTDDPLDRSLDRTFARLGMIEDADPLFAPGERLDDMGFYMVVALLGFHPVLEIFQKIYGKELAPAFYGLRTVVLTLLMMVLLRVKRPEQLRHCNPKGKGRVLGLDRVMEVKTLRRKLHQLADLNCGTELMERLGRARLEGRSAAPVDGALEIVYLDGHVQCYHGGFKVGQAWSSTRNRTVKGRTDTWLHLPGQTPLFYLESPFNEGLVKVIETHQGKIETMFGGDKPVLVFDREG